MPIHHLVISGGGPVMFRTFGALRKLEEEGFWKREDLKSIYGTSAGAVVAVVLCLNYDWDTLIKYFVERPWHEAFPVTASTIFNAFGKRGVFDKSVMRTVFKPLFGAKDISLDITLKDFYELTKISIHFYTLELHEFKTIDVCAETFPDLPLLDAVYMSSALPIICSPYFLENKCFMDGGIQSNYPLNKCLETESEADINSILGFRNVYPIEEDMTLEENVIHEESNILDYIQLFIRKLIKNVNTEKNQENIKYEVTYEAQRITLEYLQTALSSQDFRKELLNSGTDAAISFLKPILYSKTEST